MTLIFRSHTAMLLTLMLGCVLWGAVGSTNAQKRTSFTRSRLDTSSKRISAIESDSSLASSELTFTEVSITAGLGMPGMETNAVAWGDYDNDGDPDLYFANNGVNRLFRNDGNDVFTDVTTLTGTGDPGNSRGVAWGDFDNDGNLDLYVANDQGQLDVLYRNDGDDGIAGQTKFSNITLAAGTTITDGAGGVTLLDFNRDGLLDIFLAGYGDDVLYRNISDFQFAPETMYSESQQSIHLGFGAVASDVDGDGWTDIFVSDQNGGPSRLYMNEQGSLIDRAAAIGLLIEGYGNGVIALDYDRDSRMDLYWGTWPGEDRNRYRNKLMRNLGNGAFTNVGAQSLVSDANGWAMGANAADVNNDGWIDFFLANGQSGNTSSSVLFLNNGDGTFSDGTSSLGLSGGDHRGVAFADYDGDGDMDLCLTGGTLETTRLFRNDLNSSDHWLDVELTGRESNHASIGARVSVTIGTDVLVQEISGGAGLGSQNSARLHFGLGQAQFVESVQIRWPNGQLQEQLDVSVDQVLEIKEPLTSADLNNDGVVDVEDLLILLTAWGDCPDCNADVDSDDRVTVFDLLFILSSYGDIVEEVQEVDIFPAPEAGWTNFTPSADSRLVYISSLEGSDANDGLTPGTPLRTIEAGKDLMRDGMPDWLLLKRGTVFYDRIGSWDKSGRSASEPMIITGYGSNSARPRLLTGNETGIGIFSGDHVNNFVISGIHFEAHTYDGISNHIVGLLVLETGSNHLYEDCVFKNYTDNIVLQAGGVGLRNVVIRRTLVLDAFRVGVPWGKSQGMFASGVHGLLIEECIFDHNGWSEEHPSAPANIFSHNIYISNTCSDVVVRRSILTEASSHGLQLRPGGVITDNLVVRNPIGILAGGGDSPNSGGVTATVTGNIVLEGVDIGPGYPRGFGIDLKNLKSALVADNIVANKISATGGFFSIGKSVSGGPEGIGVRNTTIENNIIHNWRSPVYFNNNCLNVVVRNNVIQDPAIPDSRGLTNTYTTNPAEVSFSSNTYHSDTTDDEWFHIDWQAMPTQQWRTDFESSLELREIQFDEPSRSMGTYAGSLGLTATHDALMAQVRTQSRSNWRTEYSIDVLLTYFRNGFKESSP